ncbi:MAG: hypothetical protein C0429_13335 [Sphingopyxis sp.]|nr:hypothetical protein [Sphingopyxis sp.]
MMEIPVPATKCAGAHRRRWPDQNGTLTGRPDQRPGAKDACARRAKVVWSAPEQQASRQDGRVPARFRIKPPPGAAQAKPVGDISPRTFVDRTIATTRDVTDRLWEEGQT